MSNVCAERVRRAGCDLRCSSATRVAKWDEGDVPAWDANLFCADTVHSEVETRRRNKAEDLGNAENGFAVALTPSIAITPQTSLLLGLGVIASREDPDLDDPMQSALFGHAYVTFRRQ